MMNRRGQATTEMMFIMPLLVMILGGSMFIVYSCWQGIKVQQAANLAARIQGQERVSGGSSLQNIDNENGVGAGISGDDDPTDPSLDPSKKSNGQKRPAPSGSVYEKIYMLVEKMFPESKKSDLFIVPPVIGQNVDKVKIVRVVKLPKIPFMKSWGGAEEIKLQATAWGGECSDMYALPCWGKTGNSSDPEWKHLVKESGKAENHDQP